MRTSRFTAFLFTVFLIPFLVLPQTLEAQHKTEHLKPWSEIDFADNPNIEIVGGNKNNHCLVAQVTNIPGRKRFLIYLNAEFETGSSEITPRMKTAARKCEPIIRHYISQAHAVVFYGTDNYEPNNQSAMRPLSETRSPEREQTNDFRTGQNRANNGRNLFIGILADVPINQAGKYTSRKVQLATVSAPDSLQALNDLSDRDALEFRKSFFAMTEVYKSGAMSEQAFESRISKMNSDINRRFRRVHTRIDSLGQEHAKTRETAETALEAALAAQESANAAQQTAEEAKDQTDEQSGVYNAISVDYRREFGLNMAGVGFEVMNPVSLGFSAGISRSNIATELCNDSSDVSRAYFAEISGEYNFKPSNRVWLGVGLSVSSTLLALKDTEGLLTLSLGPDVSTRVRVWKGLSIHTSVGYNYRHYMKNTLALSEGAKPSGVVVRAGFTYSF